MPLIYKCTLLYGDHLTKRGREINTMNAVEVVQHANKAYNAHDADALAAAYAEGATYSDSRDGQVFTGKEIANYAKSVWAAYPDASVELITVADTGGGLVAAQWCYVAPRLPVVRLPFRGLPSLKLKGIKSVRIKPILTGKIC